MHNTYYTLISKLFYFTKNFSKKELFMKKGLLMMLCLSLLATAPACYKKKDKAEKSESRRPVKVKKTKTSTKKEKNGKVKKTKHKKSETSQNGRYGNDKSRRTETVTTEDMTMSPVTR